MSERRRYKLSELIAGMNEENRHPEISVGPPVGREFGAATAEPPPESPSAVRDTRNDAPCSKN